MGKDDLFSYDVVNHDVYFKMFRYNPKATYQPNGGQYFQILSGKDLYKQMIVVSVRGMILSVVMILSLQTF